MASDNTNVAPREQHSKSDRLIRFSNPISEQPKKWHYSCVFVNYSHCKVAGDFDAIKNLTHKNGASIYIYIFARSFWQIALNLPVTQSSEYHCALQDPAFLSIIHVSKPKAKLIKLFVYLSSWKNTCDSGTNTWATRVSLALRRKGRGIIYAIIRIGSLGPAGPS